MSVPRGTGLSALDAAATVYAVLVAGVDGTVLMTVEERERTRHAIKRFLTDMVEPAGFTEEDLLAHLKMRRGPGVTPDELQIGAFYLAGDEKHPWQILQVDYTDAPPATRPFTERYIYYREWRPPYPGQRHKPLDAILRAPKGDWDRPVFREVPHPWH